MKKIIFGLLLFSTSFLFAQSTIDCSKLHHAKLKFITKDGQPDFVVIDGNNHLEYQKEDGPYIKSQLKWESDCEYTAKIIEITFTDGAFKPGDKLNCKIVKIEGNIVSMIATFNGKKFEFNYEIVEYF
jgi:hypothetical protein